ncbi:MAG TPA: tetratricopeptide repeat protein [Mariprofundaceae bacterium]|nr:tetratricopeptide repeat protein [Mariprofundaceae bacterium]
MKHVSLNLLLAFALLLTGCAGKASNAAQQKKAKIHYELGIDALNKGLLPKAFDELMQSDADLPDQPEVQDALAYAWRLRGDLNKADKLYRKSLRLKSDSPATHNNYASLLLQMKRYKDAESEARQALTDPRYPNQHLAYMNLGDALLEQNKFNEAISAYRQAGTFIPGNPLPQLKEAQAYIRYERFNYAEALLQTMLRNQPDDKAAVELLVKLYQKQGKLPEARKALQAFVDKTGNDMDRAWAKDELDHLP